MNYYEVKAPNVVDRFLEVLYKDLDVIQKNLDLFQIKYRETRVRYLKGFPFGIHYIVREKYIEILAVLHTSRDPITGKKR